MTQKSLDFGDFVIEPVSEDIPHHKAATALAAYGRTAPVPSPRRSIPISGWYWRGQTNSLASVSKASPAVCGVRVSFADFGGTAVSCSEAEFPVRE